MFNTDPLNPTQGISAVKALQLASQQGQRIYTITAANQATTLPNIHHDSATMSEIEQAINQGKEVITHTDAVTVPGYTGAGYIILDPLTGDGAYKIAGGENGGQIADLILLGIAGLLALAEGLIGPTFTSIFSAEMQYLSTLSGIAKFLGVLALMAAIFNTVTNPNLSTSSQVGQIATNGLFMMLAVAMSEAIIFYLAGWLMITLVIAVGVGSALTALWVNSYLFSLFRQEEVLYA